MVDAMSSEGCIERLAGIPDIRLGSPIGRCFVMNLNAIGYVTFLSTCVRIWDEKTKAEKIEEYDGETSPMYKLNVLGEALKVLLYV